MPFRGARRLAPWPCAPDKPDPQNGSVVPAVASAVISPGRILRPPSFVANGERCPGGRPGGAFRRFSGTGQAVSSASQVSAYADKSGRSAISSAQLTKRNQILTEESAF